MIQFTVPGTPVAQPRAKATSRGGHVSMYTPTKTSSGKSNGIAEFKAAVRIAAAAIHRGPLLTGPLLVQIVAVFPRQSNRVWKTRPMPRYRHIVRPDVDNIAKSILDALKGVTWADDTQVCSIGGDKWHAAGDEAPHTTVVIREIASERVAFVPRRNPQQ